MLDEIIKIRSRAKTALAKGGWMEGWMEPDLRAVREILAARDKGAIDAVAGWVANRRNAG